MNVAEVVKQAQKRRSVPVPIVGRLGLPRSLSAGGFAGGFAWARSDVPAVRWYDGSGGLTHVARWEEDPAPLGEGMRNRITENMEQAYRSRAPGVDQGVRSSARAGSPAGWSRRRTVSEYLPGLALRWN